VIAILESPQVDDGTAWEVGIFIGVGRHFPHYWNQDGFPVADRSNCKGMKQGMEGIMRYLT
jgi:nucleoside 2-deoxyribosyltransferase